MEFKVFDNVRTRQSAMELSHFFFFLFLFLFLFAVIRNQILEWGQGGIYWCCKLSRVLKEMIEKQFSFNRFEIIWQLSK